MTATVPFGLIWRDGWIVGSDAIEAVFTVVYFQTLSRLYSHGAKWPLFVHNASFTDHCSHPQFIGFSLQLLFTVT